MIAQGLWQTSLSVQDAKGVGRSGPSIVFASKPTPGVQVPSLRFSFRDHLSFVGRRKYRTRCDCQFARHISLHMHLSPFQLVFEPSKCPSASTETSVRSKKTSVRSKKKKKQKDSKTKVRRRTERRRQQQREGKFQRASLMFFSFTRINCRFGLAIQISQSNNNHFKNTTVVHFYAFVDLATEISDILPLWRLKLSVYFHLGEYY